MQLWGELLEKAVCEHKIKIEINHELVTKESFENQICYQILLEIQKAIKDEALDDFMCVDKIVSILSDHHITCGNRHDF